MPFLRVLFWGFVVSFLGSLPLGTLNIAAMQLGIYESIKNAILFSFGSLLVEMVYVRISLVGIDWVRKKEKLMKGLEWATLAIILALAALNFYHAFQEHQAQEFASKSPYDGINVNRFLLGAGLCAINPVQIPFWFGWSAVLFEKGILQPKKSQYNFYILGIGLGTLLGNCVFIFGGKYLISRLAQSEQYLNWIIGGIFFITAVVQLAKIYRNRNKKSKLEQELEKHHFDEHQHNLQED